MTEDKSTITDDGRNIFALDRTEKKTRLQVTRTYPQSGINICFNPGGRRVHTSGGNPRGTAADRSAVLRRVQTFAPGSASTCLRGSRHEQRRRGMAASIDNKQTERQN